LGGRQSAAAASASASTRGEGAPLGPREGPMGPGEGPMGPGGLLRTGGPLEERWVASGEWAAASRRSGPVGVQAAAPCELASLWGGAVRCGAMRCSAGCRGPEAASPGLVGQSKGEAGVWAFIS